MNGLKKTFLHEQAMVNSISAAFQHAGVYLSGLSEAHPIKKRVRDVLKSEISRYAKQYRTPVTDSEHCSNIEKLAGAMSSEFGGKDVLRNNRFRIGISQKALNLY
jgi:hypothetical protein